MMQKSRSGRYAWLKVMLVIPVASALFVTLSAFETGIRYSSISDESSNLSTVQEATASEVSTVETGGSFPPPPPPPPPPGSNKNATSKETDDYSSNKVIKEDETGIYKVFTVVENMPQYPGGEQALLERIMQSLNYPVEAKENGIQGRVIVRFVITWEGKIGEVTVLKGIHSSLDNEAVRVIKSLPDWTPGSQGGKPVNVYYNVPVTFKLQ